MNKNKILIGLLTGALLLTGCGNAAGNSNTQKNVTINTDTSNDTATSSVSNNNTNQTNQYDLVGEVIEIDMQTVSVLMGDIVMTYEITGSLSNIYIGQMVAITEESQTDYSIMPYHIEDFSVRHTNMGDLIERARGKISKLDDQMVSLQLEDEIINTKVDNQDILALLSEIHINQPETELEFDYMRFGEDTYILAVYNHNFKLNLTIESIEKLDNHTLEILAYDQAGGKYFVDASRPLKNFNMSDLEVGKNIEVFANFIMESDPAQVDASRIDLISQVSTGVTSMDYEVIGDVIEIDGDNVHVLQGDLADIYTVGKEQIKSIHLGERVKLYMKDGKLTIEPYLTEDFSQTYTNMGHAIENYSGHVKKVEKTSDGHLITILNDDILIDVYYYGDILPQLDTFYEFEFVSFMPKVKNILNFYDPESIIKMTVTEISRADNGSFTFSAIDQNDGQYTLALNGVTINFNMSELLVGDVVNVYADAVMESWPMQVETSRILKVNRE